MFSTRIRNLRERRRLTQQEVADALAMSKSAIANYESGVREPKDNATWIKISKYFNVSIDYLMGITNEEDCVGNKSTDSIIIENFGFTEFDYAMHEETKNMTQEQRDAIMHMVKTINATSSTKG